MKPKEFRLVYDKGIRFDAKHLTVFIIPNDKNFHRVGITASKKGIGNAVCRNRAKRLLRETFRLSKKELAELQTKYDFVLNAKRNLLKVKLEKPLKDFQVVIGQIKSAEAK